ncbi:SDR family oxidoreductase [Rhizorhabdus argentea]|uniref:SDR family oxidoreductase n=1 Tax=Rhizorhabdus argentea TaxID=1387174 RepID=UPI0030EF73F4
MTACKTVVLTGASGGMGMAIAETLARKGHRVFAGMRSPDGRNKEKAAYLRSVDGEYAITPIELDVADDDSVARSVSGILKETAEVDVLINCAGIMATGTTEAFSTDQFRAILETNLLGPFRMYKALLPTMRAKGSGLIITITSTSGRIVGPGLGIYTASKFAIDGLAESLGYEVSGLGIDTVIVQPGPFATNLMDNQLVPEARDIVEEYGEFGRLETTLGERLWPMLERDKVSLDPQDVASLVARLIATDPGQRPIRTTVGMDSGVGEMNPVIERIQRDYLRTVGFEGLARMKS